MNPNEQPGRCHVIVVGAGSAGAVVAARLSEDPTIRVSLIEAGPDFPDEAWDPPAFLSGGGMLGERFAGAAAATPDTDWHIWSEPVSGDRRVHLHRGKMVGGSSMINGCIAVRGKPSDFERWEREGAVDWGWDDVVPYYDKVQSVVHIKTYDPQAWLPAHRLFYEAFASMGFTEVSDMNDPEAWNGVVGPWPQNRRNEVRQGTLVTYVRAARQRPNLTIIDRSPVQRVLFEGSRAVGVVCQSAGKEVRYKADLVVLSAGAYCSPAILQRSGVGSHEVLDRLDVQQVANLPVGENLRDHPQCVFMLRSRPADARMAGPGYTVVARGSDFWSFPIPLDEEEGVVGFAFGLTSQIPLGHVRAASLDADDAPVIQQNYREVIEAGLFDNAWKHFEMLAASAPFVAAGMHGGDLEQGLTATLEARLATAYHPCGTCAIGTVVDERLRVIGLENLMVADASVFPSNVENNPNLTALMVGERAADFVAEELKRR